MILATKHPINHVSSNETIKEIIARQVAEPSLFSTSGLHLQWRYRTMGIRQDSGCPLCQEEDNTTVHLMAQCSALMLLRKEILSDFTILLDMLSD